WAGRLRSLCSRAASTARATPSPPPRRSTDCLSKRAWSNRCSTIRRERGSMADALNMRTRDPLEIVQVAAFGDASAIAERLSKHFDLTITTAPNRAVAAGGLTALWHGAGQWLIVRAPAAAPLADELVALCGEDAAVVDLSHARRVLRFEGADV